MRRWSALPLAALLTACAPEGRVWFTVYDLDASCQVSHQGQPPGMPAGACDADAAGRSVFWSDDGRCWVGTRCDNPGDQPGYRYAAEGDGCFDVFIEAPRWPRC